MRKHDWPALLRAQAQSGQTIVEFCTARGLTRSKFYAERAKLHIPVMRSHHSGSWEASRS